MDEDVTNAESPETNPRQEEAVQEAMHESTLAEPDIKC